MIKQEWNVPSRIKTTHDHKPKIVLNSDVALIITGN